MTTLLASHGIPSHASFEQTLLNRGLHYGDGLFETILFHHGRLLLKELHLERLHRDSRKLYIPLKVEKIEQELDQFISTLDLPVEQAAIIKIIVTRGWGGRGYGFSEDNQVPPQPQVYFLAYPYQVVPPPEVSATICQTRLGISPTLAGIKHLSRLEQVILAHELGNKGVDEGIVCDNHGLVVEGVSSNIFAVVDGVCCTPLLDNAGVAGVMRSYLLQTVLPYLNISFLETSITPDQIMSAEELFFTNSIKGVFSARLLDNKKYTNNKVAKKIQQYLQKEHGYAFG